MPKNAPPAVRVSKGSFKKNDVEKMAPPFRRLATQGKSVADPQGLKTFKAKKKKMAGGR